MEREEAIAALKKLISDYVQSQGFELVDLIYRYEGRNLFLRVLADRPGGGISLGECTKLNFEIGNMLDNSDLIQETYTLEVSSPGLDRPLVTLTDFIRYKGRKIKIFLKDQVSGKLEWDGVIGQVKEDSFSLETAAGVFEIPIGKVNKAKQLFK